MSSNISKSSLYKILIRTSALTKSSVYVVMHNDLRASKLSKYIIMDGQKAPRRTMVMVNYLQAPLSMEEWRLLGMFNYTTVSTDNIQFREMEWAAAIGEPNILVAGEFDASSELGDPYFKEYATDGNPGTLFSVIGSRNYWLSYTLIEDATIGSIRFLPTSFPTQSPKEMILQKKVGPDWVTQGDVIFDEITPTDEVWNEVAITPYNPPIISVALSHRYWRIMLTGCGQTDAYLALERLKLYDVDDLDVTLSPGKTVTYTAQQSPTLAAENIFEDNTDQWASNGDQYRHFIAVDFGVGNAKKVVSYDLKAGPEATAPTGWRIEFSDNGLDWKMANEQYLQSWTTNEVKNFLIDNPDGLETTTPITVAASKVSANVVSFPMKINLADMPTTFWDNAKADAGNVRVTANDNTELPIDILSFDKATKTGTVYAKVDLFTGFDTILKVKTLTGGDMAAPTDPTGKYAVWSDFEAVFLMDSNVDRTVNARSLTFEGSGATIASGWLELGGLGNARVTGVAKLTSWTVSVTAIHTTLGANRTMVSYGENSAGTGTRETLSYRNASANFGVWNSTNTWLMGTGAAPVVATEYRLHATHMGTTVRRIYRNGVLAGTDNGVAQRPSGAGNDLAIGSENANTERVIGKIKDVYLRSGELSDAWLAVEELSWKDGTLYTA